MTQAADSAAQGTGAGADLSILIAGAGATGGAFGTYLQETGRDVTFLLRQARAATVRAEGMRFTAPDADRTNQVDVITAEELEAAPRTFDLVIIAVKAGGLDSVIDDIGPAVGEQTTIIPFLNGMAQIEKLQNRYPGQVLGGFVKIVGTIRDGAVVQLTDLAVMTIGDLHGAQVPRGSPTLSTCRGSSSRPSLESSTGCGRSGPSSPRPVSSPACSVLRTGRSWKPAAGRMCMPSSTSSKPWRQRPDTRSRRPHTP